MKQASLFAGIYFATLVFQGCSDGTPKATGLPGDNLDLYAVLDLFKSSKSVEEFEKSLNDKSKTVNNLDLNGDGKVDYIRVIDKYDGDDHSITLRVPVSADESQDMAVIEIEKTGDKTASIQIIGDEDMYGKDVVIEPSDKTDQAGFIYASTNIGVNVWFWPSVTYVYAPDYVVWVSPYDYDYYPVYWAPWPPVEFEVYAPLVFKNHGQFVSYEKHRFKHCDDIYMSNRMHSGFVMGREKNGEFHEGKQEHYKGNDFPKGNSGNDKHGMGNDKNMMGNDKQGGDNKKQDKGFGSPNGKESHTNAPKNFMGNDKGKNSGGNSFKEGGSQPKGGGGSPKGGGGSHQGGGGSPKGGGGKHK